MANRAVVVDIPVDRPLPIVRSAGFYYLLKVIHTGCIHVIHAEERINVRDRDAVLSRKSIFDGVWEFWEGFSEIIEI
jgi:hypothetical protein